MPIVLYVYYNLVHRHGLASFISEAAAAGVDGLLILDLPPEESEEYEKMMRKSELAVIYLIAPTTPEDRVARIVQRGSGFVYYVSREGVTGMQQQVAANLAEGVARIRRHTQLPVAVGFGISNPDQARAVAASADAVVVGSAVVNQIAKLGHSPGLVEGVVAFVRPLVDAIKR